MESGSSDSEEDFVDGMAPEVLMSVANIHAQPQKDTKLSTAGIVTLYTCSMLLASTVTLNVTN